MTARPRLEDAKGLHIFLDEYPKHAAYGILLYGGVETFLISEHVLAVPLSAALGGSARE